MELLPCPFCGGSPIKKEVCMWTGMRKQLIRVEFQHHCGGLQPRQRAYMCISAATEPEAVEAWNHRAPASLPSSQGGGQNG